MGGDESDSERIGNLWVPKEVFQGKKSWWQGNIALIMFSKILWSASS